MRKAAIESDDRQVERAASMGPHSFKCGKIFRLFWLSFWIFRFNGAALFQVRKAPETSHDCPLCIGFNGAALFQVRKAKEEESKAIAAINGRTLSSAESAVVEPNDSAARLAINGRTLSSAESTIRSPDASIRITGYKRPHSFKCGKRSRLPTTACKQSWL